MCRRRSLLLFSAETVLIMIITSTIINPTSPKMESTVAIAGTHCGKGRDKSSAFIKDNLHFSSKKQHPDVFYKRPYVPVIMATEPH